MLRRAPVKLRQQLLDAMKVLTASPKKGNNISRLKGVDSAYRLREGQWRVVYTVSDGELLVHIIKIGPRGDVYK